MNRKTVVASLIAPSLLASVLAFGATDDTVQVKGMIISRTGETLTVKSETGTTMVVLTDNTTTKDDKGLFGLDKQNLSNVVLIPGLKVKVDGVTDDQGRVVAKTITTDGDDLETAEMIQAGLHPTAEQVIANQQDIATNQKNIGANQRNIAANQQNIATSQQDIAAHKQQIEANTKDIEENTNRFTALAEYDVKGEATVNFNTGSSVLSAKGKEDLSNLAKTALEQKGYIIEVVGYADSTGSAAMNTQLSGSRAKAVVTYLMQQGNVPVRHIVAPGAMGEYGAAAPNETASGRAENRRVVVKVLVNRGVAGTM
jgi:OOP family OmpA-OmpF porin